MACNSSVISRRLYGLIDELIGRQDNRLPINWMSSVLLRTGENRLAVSVGVRESIVVNEKGFSDNGHLSPRMRSALLSMVKAQTNGKPSFYADENPMGDCATEEQHFSFPDDNFHRVRFESWRATCVTGRHVNRICPSER